MKKLITSGLILTIAVLNLCGRDFSKFTIGTPDQTRTIAYSSVGAVAGAVIGNQMSGDRSEKRAIGAGIGAVTGAIFANSENKRIERVENQRAQRAYELEVRRIEQDRRRDIAIGRSVTDGEILREEHEVAELENEIARIERERAEAEARARRIRELKERKALLEKELGTLKSLR